MCASSCEEDSPYIGIESVVTPSSLLNKLHVSRYPHGEVPETEESLSHSQKGDINMFRCAVELADLSMSCSYCARITYFSFPHPYCLFSAASFGCLSLSYDLLFPGCLDSLRRLCSVEAREMGRVSLIP